METEEIFSRNLETFRKINPEAAYLVEKAVEKRESFWIEEPADNGEITAYVEDPDGGISFIEGMNDPRGVAEKKVAVVKDGWDVVVMGVGLGYVLEPLCAKADKLGKVLIIERRPEMLARAFMYSDYSTLMERESTVIFLAYASPFFRNEIDTDKTILIRNEVLVIQDDEYYTLAFSSLKHTEFRVFPLLTEEKYNILLMCEDSLRRDRLSFYGGDPELCPTPDIDAFFKDAFVFDTYTMSTWTPTVFASILSGLMPWEHGMVREILSGRKDKMETRPNKPFTSTVARLAGMERLKVLLSGNFWINRNFGFGRGFNLQMFPIGGRGYYGDEMNMQARIMIEPLKKSSFFFFMHYMDTHQPFLFMEDGMVDISTIRAKTPADPRRDPLYKRDLAEEIQAYNSSVVAADVHIGDLLGLFMKHKLEENTIIALFSDHGEELRDHGTISYPRHGYSLYNELIDVPLIIYVPEPLREFVKGQMARFQNRRFHLIDLIPLLEAIADRREFDPSWFSDTFFGFAGFKATKAFVLENGLKLIYDLEKGCGELYDLKSDPGEKASLAGAEDEAERLKRKLFEILPPDFRGVEEELHVYDEKEMEEIQNRLRDLGYM